MNIVANELIELWLLIELRQITSAKGFIKANKMHNGSLSNDIVTEKNFQRPSAESIQGTKKFKVNEIQYFETISTQVRLMTKKKTVIEVFHLITEWICHNLFHQF